jgi:hypothetical protein
MPPGNAPGFGSNTSETAKVTGLTSPRALPVNWSLQIFPSRSYLTSQEKLPGIAKGAYSVIGPAPAVSAEAGFTGSVIERKPQIPMTLPVTDLRSMVGNRIAQPPLKICAFRLPGSA